MDPNSLPSNSNKSRVDYANPGQQTAQAPGRQKKTAVVSASVVPEGKKSFGRKLKEAFAPQMGEASIGDNILTNVFAPAVKGMLYTAGMTVLGGLIYGAMNPGANPYNRYANPGGFTGYNPFGWGAPRYANPTATVNYGAMARPQQNVQQALPKSSQGPQGATDILFNTKAEAELVRDSLAEILVTYHQVSLLDFYETCGIQGNSYTDAYVGWTDLSQLRLREAYGGWVIDLPRPSPLQHV